MSENFEFGIEANDWKQEYDEEEPEFRNTDDLLDRLRTKHIARVARELLVARELGAADPDIIQPNKPLLNIGGTQAILGKMAALKQRVKLPNGTEFDVRTTVMPVRDEEDEESSSDDEFLVVVEEDPEKSIARSTDYLFKRAIRGYMGGRLKIIAACGGDLGPLREQVHEEVDALFDRLT